MSILPSILWLVIGVIKAAGEGEDASASVRALEHIIRHQQHGTVERWISLQQSALQRLLDLAKTSDDSDTHRDGEDINILAAIAVFLLYSKPSVITEAPGLKYPAVNAFVRGFQQESDSGAKKRVVEVATSVLAAADRSIAQPLAQAMAPPVLDYLLVDETSRAAKNPADLALTHVSIYMVEVLMTSPNLAPTSGEDKRLGQLMLFLIPILVSQLLAPEEMKEASKLALSLHYLALGKLTSIGQTWPNHLKGVLGQNELLRGRLELAVKADQERSKTNSSQKSLEVNKINQPSTHRIKLVDFKLAKESTNT